MKRNLEAISLVWILSSFVLFVACGDDSSSVASSDEIDSSSSVTRSEAEKSSSSFANSSSSLVLSSSTLMENLSSGSSVAYAEPCRTDSSDKCEFGTLTDERDGKIYKIVKIGNQWWMAENLNYESEKSFCYMDSSEYCSKYGRLYTWAAAIDSMRLATDKEHPQDCGYDKICSILEKVQGICPEGWSLPSTYEWNVLFSAVGGEKTAGKMLKSTSGWNDYREGDSGNGSDDYMFSVLSAGYRYFDTFKYEGEVAYYWCSTEENYESHGDFAYSVVFGSSKDGAFRVNRKNLAFSVRCVKD